MGCGGHLKFPVVLLIIFSLITIACNWGAVTNLPSDDWEKVTTIGEMALLTPYRIARSALSSYTYWQETGDSGAFGWMLVCGLGLLALFSFLHGLVAWFIGFIHAPASEERKSFIAFVTVLALIALAVSTPFDPNLVVSVVLLLFAMWVCIKVFERWRTQSKKAVKA